MQLAMCLLIAVGLGSMLGTQAWKRMFGWLSPEVNKPMAEYISGTHDARMRRAASLHGQTCTFIAAEAALHLR